MDEIYSELEKLENGTDLINKIKLNVKKLNDENASKRIHSNEIQSQLDEQKNQMSKLMESVSPILKAVSNDDKITTEDLTSDVATRLTKEIEDLRNTVTESTTKLEAERADKLKLKMNSEIGKLLDTHKLSSKIKDDYSTLLANQLKFAEDGVLQTSDGIKATEYVENFLSERKEILEPTVSRGNLTQEETTGVAQSSNSKSFTEFCKTHK